MRTIPLLIALILWFILGYFFYDSSKTCCDSDTSDRTEVSKATTTAPVAPVVEAVKNTTGPLMFNWSNAATITGDGWDVRRKGLIEGLKDNQILEITGLYRSDEANTTTFENLGVARASEASKLFVPPLSKDRIRLVGKLTTGEVDKANPFVSASFRNRINTANIKEVDDKTIIRFPFNSTRKLSSREVENYLNDVADRVKKSGERVRLTGHTDNIGSTASNKTLGQRRADIIKAYLVKRGVASGKILASSQGEAKPIATNNTDEGRATNRRTELQIIK